MPKNPIAVVSSSRPLGLTIFLKCKLLNEFSKGNSKAREQLFASNGPFATFSGKLNAAFCAGWIDADVYHDVQIIRKIRNDCAHDVNPISLYDEHIRKLLEDFRVPYREYLDWGKLRAVSTDDSVIIYIGERPQDAKEDLYIPGVLTFRMSISVIVAVLVSNLGIPFSTEDPDTITVVTIPDYMKNAQ
ncbi:MAG: DUF4145 domain-containing protein [Firmicutes bacterium]|nr:DUF4145 domain-containing protein [Bacillota bacterium]